MRLGPFVLALNSANCLQSQWTSPFQYKKELQSKCDSSAPLSASFEINSANSFIGSKYPATLISRNYPLCDNASQAEINFQLWMHNGSYSFNAMADFTVTNIPTKKNSLQKQKPEG